jgi:hypothetical protein
MTNDEGKLVGGVMRRGCVEKQILPRRHGGHGEEMSGDRFRLMLSIVLLLGLTLSGCGWFPIVQEPPLKPPKDDGEPIKVLDMST